MAIPESFFHGDVPKRARTRYRKDVNLLVSRTGYFSGAAPVTYTDQKWVAKEGFIGDFVFEYLKDSDIFIVRGIDTTCKSSVISFRASVRFVNELFDFTRIIPLNEPLTYNTSEFYNASSFEDLWYRVRREHYSVKVNERKFWLDEVKAS